MKKLTDRFFAEHVVVISGQADGPLVILKWVDGKLVVVKPPPEPDPRFNEFSQLLNVLNVATRFNADVSKQIAHALQPLVEQHLSNALEGMH
jgi:hypothetical protein